MVVIAEAGHRLGSKLYHIKDGYYYHINRRCKNFLSLRCIYYYSKGCSARASCSVDLKTFKQLKNTHTHGKVHALPYVRNLRRKILERCIKRDPSRFVDIVERESEGFSRKVRSLNGAARLRSAMHRARLRHFPTVPQDLSELHDILCDPTYEHLSETLSRSGRMYAGKVGSARNRTRCCLFMSRKMISVLRTARNVFCDSTWDGRPVKPHSSQLFSMVTIWDHQVIPVCVALMESKKKMTYARLFQAIKFIAPTFQPEKINCDFETGQYSAALEAFPDARVVGCLFHYAKNVSLYARQLGFTPDINSSRIFASCVRCLLAIPLVPEPYLERALEAVRARAQLVLYYDRLEPLLLYVRKEYIIKRGQMLSVYGSADRTTNAVESFHAKLQNTMVDKQPNVFQFIGGLLRLEERAQQDIYCLQRGISTRRSRKVSAVSNDAAIRRMQQALQCNHISMFQFLRRASYRLIAAFRQAFPDAGSDDDGDSE